MGEVSLKGYPALAYPHFGPAISDKQTCAGGLLGGSRESSFLKSCRRRTRLWTSRLSVSSGSACFSCQVVFKMNTRPGEINGSPLGELLSL